MRIDRVRKLPKYSRAGVGHAWLMDPIARVLELFRRHEEGWLLAGSSSGDDKVRAEPFDAIELELAALWLPEAAPP